MADYEPSDNPYRTAYQPKYPTPKQPPGGTPQVVIWEMVYCVAMSLLYLAVGIIGLLMLQNIEMLVDEQTGPAEIRIMGILFAAMGFPFALLYAAGLLWRKGTGGWVFHIVLISIGLTSACCLPTNIPLLIFWIKDKDRIIR